MRCWIEGIEVLWVDGWDFMRQIKFDQASEFFRGAEDNGCRMSSELLEFFSADPLRLIRAKCASGVQIVFSTDSSSLIWECRFGGFAREIFTADILVDGQLFTLDGAGPHVLNLPAGQKEIVVHLPHLAVLEDYSLQLDDNAECSPLPDKQPTLIICGDSILQGMTCTSPSRAAAVIAARENAMTLYNTSVGGALMHPEAVRLSLKHPGECAVIGLGINDAGFDTGLDIFRARTRLAMQHLADFPGRKFMITPIPATRADIEPKRPEYCRIIREIHADFPQINLLDGDELFPADEQLFVDGLHPNDRGIGNGTAQKMKIQKS